MKRTRGAILFFCLITSPVALMANDGNAKAGKDVYTKHCVACHGQDGQGNEAVANVLKTTIPPLPSKEVQALSDAEITKVITDGKDKMPAQKGLSSTDVANVVAFIRSIAQK